MSLLKLLVADDDPMSRQTITSFLAQSELQLRCVTDGAEAWQYLSMNDPPRIAILDWMMPKLNGLEICRKIRERGGPHYIYVILLTGRTGKIDMLAGFEAGADDYLTKPLSRDELLARVQNGRRVLAKEDQLTDIIQGWRTMLDSLPFGVACLGHRGELRRANKIFVEMLGYEIKMLLGKSLSQTVMPNPTDFARLMEFIRYSEAFDSVPMRMVLQGGVTRDFIVWGRPIGHSSGIVFQIITAFG